MFVSSYTMSPLFVFRVSKGSQLRLSKTSSLEFELNLYFHRSCPVVKNICFVRCYDSKGWKEDGKSTPDFVEKIDCTTLGGGDNGSPEESKESTVAGEPVETEDPDPTDEATEEPEPTEEPEETEEPEPEPTEDTNSNEPTEEPEETEEPNTSNEATEEPLEPATNNAATEEPDEIVTDGSETPTQNAKINPTQEPEPVTNPVNNPVVDPEEEVSGKYRA